MIILHIIFLFLGLVIGYNLYKQTTHGDCLDKNFVINTLIRQSSRWSVASEQDENAIIAVLHGNYGAAYLYALQEIVTDSEIKKYANVDIKKFALEIKRIQELSTKNVIGNCEKLRPKNIFLSRIAGEA